MLGVRNWPATAYHPDTQALYIPMSHLSCTGGTFSEVEKKSGVGGYVPIPGFKGAASRPHPASPDHIGGMVAMDIDSGKLLWKHSTRMSMTAAALTTAGGLVITGDAERHLYVHDAENGKHSVPNAPGGSSQGFSGDLCGRRQTVSGDPDEFELPGRPKLVRRREHDIGVCAAGTFGAVSPQTLLIEPTDLFNLVVWGM